VGKLRQFFSILCSTIQELDSFGSSKHPQLKCLVWSLVRREMLSLAFSAVSNLS